MGEGHKEEEELMGVLVKDWGDAQRLKHLLRKHEGQRSEHRSPLKMPGEHGCPAATPDKLPRAGWPETSHTCKLRVWLRDPDSMS